jgi:hypothetical protein
MRWAALVLAVSLGSWGSWGCAGDKSGTTDTGTTETGTPTETGTTTDTEPPPEGAFTLNVRFAIDPDYVPEMDEPPVGRIWGTVFRTAEVTSIGPDPGAEELASIAVTTDVDLPTDGTATAVITTVSGQGPASLTILGFLDSDANADDAAPGPDD